MMAASVDAARGWIRYAFQHGMRSLILDVHLMPVRPRLCGEREDGEGDDEKPAAVLLPDDLPSPARLETMRLSLGGARLRLSSATVKFASLKDLSLERIRIADGGGARLLARLVSAASCPHLQKLRMSRLRFPNFGGEMRLEADALSELWVEDMSMMSLELSTPGLRILHIDDCYLEVLSLSAPRLEQAALFFGQGSGWPLRLFQVDGDLPCLLSLKICMWAYRALDFHCIGEQNDCYTLLLKHCSLRTRLEVTLGGGKNNLSKEHEDVIKDKVPHLPQITSLTVNVSDEFERHDFGAGVASLLTRFTNLRHLSLHLPFFVTLYYDLGEGLDLECDHPDHWASYEISMAHLQEVELTGLTGIDCELWFMEAVIASARRLRKASISFNTECWQHECKMDAFERMLLDEGMRTSCRDKFKLTCLINK
ncbi:hypothetical protein PVAP13_4KG051300 [Panicum virgatum]|uniref:FBD domain-containing protein n=2 Tax=Panicum virgatum TaxID=38727 RepID=A0A8T0TKD8_PANVG|nr:hypothetical protein PVAP13_4KG051300 [Panicum virgatum]